MVKADLTGATHTCIWQLLFQQYFSSFSAKVFIILLEPATHLDNLNVYLHVHMCTYKIID